MDNQELRILQILEAIEKEQAPSQRDLARRLDVSLGLVNSFIKRLVHKGYFKVTSIPRNRIRYMLTPKGAAEKARLTCVYIQHTLEFYKTAREKLRKVFQSLIDRGAVRVVFYGATDLAEIAYISLKETPLQLVGVVDETKAGQHFVWGAVQELSTLKELAFDIVLVTLADAGEDVTQKLSAYGVSSETIATIQ